MYLKAMRMLHSQFGGAMHVDDDSFLDISDCSFTLCAASASGTTAVRSILSRMLYAGVERGVERGVELAVSGRSAGGQRSVSRRSAV
eukprot:496018-Pleurochrysis_carterae.AAC.4